MVFLGWWHSSDGTPSVSPYGLPAPPPGSQGPCCPRWGWCAAQRIKIVMIAGGNHTSVSCRVSGKGGVVGNFELVPFNEPHPLSLALLDSSPTGEPRFPCCPRWGAERAGGQVQSSVRRKSRILRCLMPLRLISNSSRETTYLGKLSRILSYAPNSRLTVSSEASR